MGADKIISTIITADSNPFEQAMKVVQQASDTAFGALEKRISSLASPLTMVQGHLSKLTGLLAGGGAFGNAIAVTKEWSGEQAGLAKQLQITTEQAAAYQIATREIGLSGDVLITASDKMTKQLANNEQAFKKIGISTRDSNGAFRSTGDILPEVIAHLQGIHNTTEQNTQGIALFGKGWNEVRGILKLSADALAAAQQKARDLNLVTDPAQLKAYKAAMADVKLVSTSLDVQIGNALLPTLTKLGSFMSSEGPTAAGIFKTMIDGVGGAFINLWFIMQIAATKLAAWAAFAAAALEGNWTGAKDILNQVDDDVDALSRKWDKARADFAKPMPVAKANDDMGGPHVDLTKDKAEKKDPSRVGQWEAELAEFKLAQQEKALVEGRFFEMSKADERAFWQAKLATTVAGTAENASVRKKNAELGLAVQKDAFDTELQGLKTQADAYKNNLDAKLAIVEQEATMIGQKYGLESKEYKAVQGEIVKIKREAAAQQVQLEEAMQEGLRQRALGELDVRQETANEQLALGLINQQQMLQLERQFEDQRAKIASDAQRARIAAMETDPDRSAVALQKEKDQLLAIERQHQQAVARINTQITVEETADMRNYISSLGQQFGTVFAQLLQRQTTFSAASRQLWNGLVSVSAQAGTKILQDKIRDWVAESSIYKSIVGQKSATDAAAGLEGIAAKKAEAAESIPASTGEAAIGAAASVASIPYVGPFLAAAAYAEMIGLGAAAAGIASAAGGYDIPAFSNPLVQTHAEEMILPAKHANVIRGMADNGGPGGGGDVHLHVHALDAKSVTKLFADNGGAIAAALKQQRRGFNPDA